MASAAATTLLRVTSLHEGHQGKLASFYLLLKLLEGASGSDSSSNVFEEIFTNRLGAYRLQETVKNFREFCNDGVYIRQLGGLPPEPKV